MAVELLPGLPTAPMEILWVGADSFERHEVGMLDELLARPDGFVWLDIPQCDEPTAQFLGSTFGFHQLALRDCLEPTHVPKVYGYSDHVYLALHVPEPGAPGVVHLLELDQFVGRRYLITLHEAHAHEELASDAALRETEAVRRRILSGRFRPASAASLSYAIVSAVARRMETFEWKLAARLAQLERNVVRSRTKHPQELLEDMFQLRHELLVLRTAAAQNREIYARLTTLATRFWPADGRQYIDDLLDQFDRVRNMCDGEKELLQGVVDFYHTRTTTRINVAMERLALLTALVLPVTAVASIYGMNVIVSDRTDVAGLTEALAVMLVLMAGMLIWTRRQGWW